VSIIVRLWPSDNDSSDIRGEVEHVATGEKRMFADSRSLLQLLASWQRDLEVAI
jgi:hypothetical protein